MKAHLPPGGLFADPDPDCDPEREPGGAGRSRPLGHGDLRLVLLALIEQQPRHGDALMRQIAALFKGRYTPSAGAIYPALAQLETDGWGRHRAPGPAPEGRRDDQQRRSWSVVW